MTADHPPMHESSEIRGHVTSVSVGALHEFSKSPRPVVRLLEGLGVEGDAHCGTTVKHRSRVRRNPDQPNLRQVHLIQSELFDGVAQHGNRLREYLLAPGDMGENVTTTGIDLLALPVDTVLRLGDSAEVVLTGLRNPCSQIDDFAPGLLKLMVSIDENGQVIRKAGVMAVVRRSGEVRAGDPVTVVLPTPPHVPLDLV